MQCALPAAVLSAMCLTSLAAAAQDRAPWLGTWQLDPGRSTTRAQPSPYKRVTLSIASSNDEVTVVYDMVGIRGGVTHVEWTGRFDGRDYPVQGVDAVMTNAYRLLDAHRYEIVVKTEGRVAATSVVAVSPDLRTMTVTTSERNAAGRSLTTTAVYSRRSD